LQRKKKANLKKEPNPFLPTSCLLAYMYAWDADLPSRQAGRKLYRRETFFAKKSDPPPLSSPTSLVTRLA
jgi:hypothetical protein